MKHKENEEPFYIYASETVKAHIKQPRTSPLNLPENKSILLSVSYYIAYSIIKQKK